MRAARLLASKGSIEVLCEQAPPRKKKALKKNQKGRE